MSRVAEFHLAKLTLSSAGRPAKSPLHFAKECAVRMVVTPPKGTRIKGVTANTRIVSSKVANATLSILSELKIGKQALGSKQVEYPKGSVHVSAEEGVALHPGTKPDEQFPTLGCEEPKIVAFNYTWITQLDTPADHVEVRLSGDKTLTLSVELEQCPTPQTGSSKVP